MATAENMAPLQNRLKDWAQTIKDRFGRKNQPVTTLPVVSMETASLPVQVRPPSYIETTTPDAVDIPPIDSDIAELYSTATERDAAQILRLIRQPTFNSRNHSEFTLIKATGEATHKSIIVNSAPSPISDSKRKTLRIEFRDRHDKLIAKGIFSDREVTIGRDKVVKRRESWSYVPPDGPWEIIDNLNPDKTADTQFTSNGGNQAKVGLQTMLTILRIQMAQAYAAQNSIENPQE